MKKAVMKFVLIIGVFLLVSAQLHSKNFYLSNNGADSNSGQSESSAWASLNKLQTEIDANRISTGDNIFFERNSEFRGKLVLKVEGLVFSAYGVGDNPVFKGSNILFNFTRSGNIWTKTNVYLSGKDEDLSNIYINSKPFRLARYPKSGYLHIDSYTNKTSITDDYLSSLNTNLTGTEFISRVNNWTIDRLTITNHTGSTLTFSEYSNYNFSTSGSYFLQNNEKFLVANGDWTYNVSTKTLKVYYTGDLNQQLVEIPVEDIGIDCGRYSIDLKNITLKHYSDYGVYAYNPNFLKIGGCEFSELSKGVKILGTYEKPNDFIVSDTKFQNLYGGAISCFYSRISITNNFFENIALTPGIGSSYGGVNIRYCDNTSKVEYNQIKNIGYNGITWMQTGIRIYRNILDKTNQILGDGGSIYTYKTTTPSYVGFNIVSNPGSPNDPDHHILGIGLYQDNLCDNVIWESNTVYNCGLSFYLHESYGSTFKNNLAFNAGGIDSRPGMFFMGSPNINNSITGNVIVGNEKLDKVLDFYKSETENNTVDRNYYIAPWLDDSKLVRHWQGGSFGLSTWYAYSGWDRNSKSSPVDYRNSEFTLNDIAFLLNTTSASKSFSLNQNFQFVDKDGNEVGHTITVKPFESQVFFPVRRIVNSGNNAPSILTTTISTGGNLSPGQLLGSIEASDIDPNQTLTFSLVSGNNSEVFWLSPTSGRLYLSQAYSSDLRIDHNITVQVTDNGSPAKNSIAEVHVIEDSDQPSGNLNPIISNQSLTVENVVSGSFLGKIQATDANGLNNISYAIISGNEKNMLWLSSSSGNLYADVSYNQTDDLSSTLVIKVTDKTNNSLISTANINIIHKTSSNVNQAPQTSDYEFTVDGPTGPGVFIGKVEAFDPDENQTLKFEILSSTNANDFWISSTTGNLYTSSGFTSSKNLTGETNVKISDNGVPVQSVISKIVVKHTTIDNNSPVISDQSLKVKSISAGDLIGKVVAIDTDEGQMINYQLVSGNQLGNLWLSPSSGNLYASSSYDGSTDLSGVITIEVTDNGSPVKKAMANLTIEQEANTPPIVSNQIFNIVDNIGKGEFVGKITAVDIENSPLTFQIVNGNENGFFWLAQSSGNLYTSQSYTDQFLSATLTIKVTDQGVPSKSSQAIISVNHTVTNHAPVIRNQTFSIVTNYQKGDFIGKVVANDPDLDQSITYEILSGNNNNLFWISSVSGNLYTSGAYNGVDNLTKDLVIGVKDNHDLSLNSQATISVIQTIEKSRRMSDEAITEDVKSEDLKLSIFPNPAINELNIDITSDNKSVLVVELMNISGSTLMSKTYRNDVSWIRDRIDISHLSEGIYFITIKSGDNVVTKKIIKQ